MSTTVLEALQGAQMNLETIGRLSVIVSRHPIYSIAMDQLKNAIEALEDGKSVNFVLQDFMGGEINK